LGIAVGQAFSLSFAVAQMQKLPQFMVEAASFGWLLALMKPDRL
jgi:hypothetical protein